MSEKHYTNTDRKNAQHDILRISTADNPNFPQSGPFSNRFFLQIKDESGNIVDIITALNKLFNDLNSLKLSSLDNLNRQFEILGNFVDNPELETNLKKIDENALKSLYKIYQMIVGTGTPHTISIANNIHQAINVMNEKVQHIDEDVDGNMTWKGQLIEGSGAGGDVLYTNENPTPLAVGGISVGSTFQNKSVKEMFDMMLYPELYPTLTNPSFTFTLNNQGFQEIGTTLDLIFTATFNRGSILPSYGTNGYRSGLPNSFNYTGSGLSTTFTSNMIDTKLYSGFIVSSGTTTWGCNISYSGGEQPLTSKGSHFNVPLGSGMTSNKSVSITGVYPYFGTTSNILTMSKQPLASMSSNYVQLNMVAEDGSNKQSVEFPNVWSSIVGIQFYNTINGQWEWLNGNMVNSLNSFSVDTITKSINGVDVLYKKYVHNGSTIGARNLRFYSS